MLCHSTSDMLAPLLSPPLQPRARDFSHFTQGFNIQLGAFPEGKNQEKLGSQQADSSLAFGAVVHAFVALSTAVLRQRVETDAASPHTLSSARRDVERHFACVSGAQHRLIHHQQPHQRKQLGLGQKVG